MARDLRAEFGLRTFSLFGSAGAAFTGLDPQERKYGFHAGEIETAFLLSAIPELVHPDEYTVNYIATLDNPEYGTRWIEEAVTAVAAALQAMLDFKEKFES
jgi:creatinine amidohydrolase